MKNTFIFSVTLLLLFPGLFAFAQSKKDLEDERKNILARINETNKTLQATKRNKAGEMANLRSLNSRIRQSRNLIAVTKKEIRSLENLISENSLIIESLRNDLEGLKEEYGAMLFVAYKAQDSYGKLSYLFAAGSIRELLERMQYFRLYENVREEQIEQIEAVSGKLLKREEELDSQKDEKVSLIDLQNKEQKKLSGLKVSQQRVISDIRKKESQIAAELKKEKSVLGELKKLISAHIRSAAFSSSLSDSEKMISTAFAKSKGSIIRPVESGFVTGHFGLQPYLPDDKNNKDINIDKLGIDIRTQPGMPVRSVFAGTVVDVTKIKGRGYMVIIQHGDYFTVYGKLDKPKVKPGQKIKLKQAIGVVSTGVGGVAEMEFQVWRHQDKLNPEKWIRK